MPKFELGDFINPLKYQDPLNIEGMNPTQLKKYLIQMTLIRKVEQKLARERANGSIGGPVHLGVGQEAVAVGVSAHLRSTDRVFGAHRSHSHVLALGCSVHGLFAEVLGKETGLSKGMGGSMHLWDQPNGFYGSVPIVAGTVPLAVGAGLAAKMQRTGDIGVAYFGDGAIEEGGVHESLNLARVLDVPVLFVVENNLFASHMHISLRQPTNSVARFAEANDIPYAIVDGNDVSAVERAAGHLIEQSRSGKGPGFLEAITYRWYGHVDWREDIDVGVERSEVDVENWRGRDPIRRLREPMLTSGVWTEADDAELSAMDPMIETAWTTAMNDPYPAAETLLNRVYARQD